MNDVRKEGRKEKRNKGRKEGRKRLGRKDTPMSGK